MMNPCFAASMDPAGRRDGGAPMHRRAGRRAATLLLIALLPLAGACDFDVQDPTRLTDESLQSDAAMTALMVGAVKSYDDAYDRLVMFTGLLSDELIASGSWQSWHRADKEGFIDLFDSESDHINIPWRAWRELARARGAAAEANTWMQEVLADPASDPRVATVLLYEGTAYADFAEVFCQAAYDGGPVVDREGSFALAEEHLNQAIQVAQAASADSIVDRARLVLARVHMGLGDLDAALADARAVPDGMLWLAHFRDASGERSYFWDNNAIRGESSVDPRFRDTGDPRVPVDNQERPGPDGETIVWAQMKYPDRNSDFIIGKWQEARLIEAEILLERNQTGEAVALMNQVREAADLPPFSAGLTADEAWEALRQERAYELWLEGRRMIDMRRWGQFPEGWGATCIPISREEKDSNPNLQNVQLIGWP